MCQSLSRTHYVPETEASLEKKAVSLFRKTHGPIFVLQSSMNIDRIVTLYRAAKQSGRVFLQELYMADITSAIGGHIPNPQFPDVYAFITQPKRYEKLRTHPHRVGKDFISKPPFVMGVRPLNAPLYPILIPREKPHGRTAGLLATVNSSEIIPVHTEVPEWFEGRVRWRMQTIEQLLPIEKKHSRAEFALVF